MQVIAVVEKAIEYYLTILLLLAWQHSNQNWADCPHHFLPRAKASGTIFHITVDLLLIGF